MILNLELFDRKGNGLRSICKKCVSEYSKVHYVKKKEYYLEKASKNRRLSRLKLRQFIFDYYSNHPCVDCGENDPVVLAFDHLRDKFLGISKMLNRSFSLVKIQQEIDKCQVVCANCHKRRTAKQFNWYFDLKHHNI